MKTFLTWFAIVGGTAVAGTLIVRAVRQRRNQAADAATEEAAGRPQPLYEAV
jgi:hypothetical protein